MKHYFLKQKIRLHYCPFYYTVARLPFLKNILKKLKEIGVL